MLTDEQGEKLVGYAREVLESYIRDEGLPEAREEDFMDEKKGVFVTLKKNDELRGCVGLPLPRFPLREAVKKAARLSADDRRFPPIDEKELRNITIEVTVLTEPETVDADSPDDYIKKVEVGKHGLIISKGGREGLLLPQVPIEQNWSCTEYLEGLCRKARLDSDAWKRKSTEIKRFEGQIFRE